MKGVWSVSMPAGRAGESPKTGKSNAITSYPVLIISSTGRHATADLPAVSAAPAPEGRRRTAAPSRRLVLPTRAEHVTDRHVDQPDQRTTTHVRHQKRHQQRVEAHTDAPGSPPPRRRPAQPSPLQAAPR